MAKFFRHKRDHDGSCSKMGESSEEIFAKLAANNGFEVIKAGKKLEFDKVDFILVKNTKRIKVDVKSRKRISRSDKQAQDDLLWVEISDVSKKEGNNGWIYGGADVIAFEKVDCFVLVNREGLAKYVETFCDLKTFVKTSKEALYKSYRRKDRPAEHLSIVDFGKMIKEVQHTVWNKFNDKNLEDGLYIEGKETKDSPWVVLNEKPFATYDEALIQFRKLESLYAECIIRKKTS